MRAARMIGGDFYDVFRLDDHRLGVIVADVSGKGVPAALFMVLVRTLLQDLALTALSPAACIAEANRQLIARNPISLFVTTVYGILDSRTGQFTFCNGGHITPYVLRAHGGVEVVTERSSPLVGLLDMAVYTDHTIMLRPGDALMLVTDGIAECFNSDGQMYGEERLLDLLASHVSTPVDRLLDTLLAELDEFSVGTQMSDDVTVLTLRYVGNGIEDTEPAHAAGGAEPGRTFSTSPSRALR
jgi:sigma-B regulation protein RsbU (phosphoserine phosphatase)